MRKIHYILTIAVLLLVSAIAVAYVATRSNKRLLDELNSFGESNFEFANYEFFLNLKRNQILLYNLQDKYSCTEIEGYVIIVVPLKSRIRNLEGMQNQVHHRNTSAVEYAAYQMLKGNREIGLSIFRLYLELNPGYYLTGSLNEKNRLDRYFPQIEKCFRGEDFDSSLLEQEAMQFRFKRKTYSLNL
jgi:hypothetical protein